MDVNKLMWLDMPLVPASRVPSLSVPSASRSASGCVFAGKRGNKYLQGATNGGGNVHSGITHGGNVKSARYSLRELLSSAEHGPTFSTNLRRSFISFMNLWKRGSAGVSLG